MNKAALIGSPVSHSLSPALHNFWCKKHGVSGGYEAVALGEKELDKFLDRIRGGEFVGANVTVPHKEKIFEKMDTLDNVALKTGAVNTIVAKEGGVLEGRNTDPEGFIENLLFQAPGLNLQTTKAVILGTGGAARACFLALLEKGIGEIVVVGRSENKVKYLVDFFSSPAFGGAHWDSLNASLSGADLLVNATSLGLGGSGGPDVDFSRLSKQAVVYDLVYTPPETMFLKAAKSANLKTVDGLGMLIRQAIPAFEAWFGVRPEFDSKIYGILKQQQVAGKI